MALGETGFERGDMDSKEVQDVTDILDSAFYFKELIKDLRFYKTSDPDQKVRVAGEDFKMAELLQAFEVFDEYVYDNRDLLKEDPDRIRNYLDGVMPATKILGLNKDLQDTAVGLARKELGLSGESVSM